MAGLPIGHARVPTDQKVLTVGSGETNDAVDDPSARSGLDWARSDGRTLRRPVRRQRRWLHGPFQRSTSWLFGRLE
jgi:hypothetical protein